MMAAVHARGDTPLKILMVSARYLPFVGGTETHVHEVSTRLVAAGYAVTVLTADPSGALPTHERTATGVEVVRARAYPRGRDWCFAPGLFRGVAGRLGIRADVVHVQGYHTFAAPFAMAGALARGVPFVLTFHSGGHSSPVRTRMRAAQQGLLAPLAARAACLIGVSEFEADHFSRAMAIPRTRFQVVPNGASLPPPTPGGGLGTRGTLVVSLGRLERYKGHHRVILAFERLRRQVPDARLRILGEGPYEAELRALVDRLDLAGAVEIGAIAGGERGQMAALLSGASLVALLSDYEAHPVAVMEALSLGRPVLTTDTSGFRELAERGLVRALPVQASPDEVAAAMMTEMARPRTGRLALPDWDACASRLLSIYHAVARPRAPGPLGRLGAPLGGIS